MPKAITESMSKDKARACCDRVKECLADIHRATGDGRESLAELRAGKGWLALGYATWKALLDAEFGGITYEYARKLITAANVEKTLERTPNESATTVALAEATGQLPERHARELAKVADEHKAKVIRAASEAVKGKPVTAESLKAARKALAEPPPLHPWHAVAEKWAEALRAADALHSMIRELAGWVYGKSLAKSLGNKNDKPHCTELAAVRNLIRLCAPTDCPRCKAKGCKLCADKGWVNVQYARTLGDDAKI